ncbi:MAG TPA: hypothetical protein DIS80_12580 [Verrucomicrobiales bacterium]|nr:hypothetical protein [Verrucomicrobiales bacterium]
MQNTPIKLATLAALLIGPRVFADYPATVLASNPLAYYRFEEGPGATTLVDSSGNGLDIDNSIPVGTTLLGSDGAVGSAVTFNGDGYLVSPLNLDTSVGDFTIEAIIKRTAGAPEGVVIANQDGNLGPGRSNLVVNGGGLITTFSGGATTNSGIINTGEDFDHVILTFDQSAVAEGVDPTFRFFINGAEAGTGTAIPEAANGSWVIGANKILTTQFFNGVVDDVAIYGSRLDDPNGDGDSSDSKIGEHYKGFLSDSITVGSFGSSVAYLDSGQSAELNWLVSPELSSLTLDDGAGPIDVLVQTIDGEGSIVVSPAATTTYTLIGTGSLGSESVEVEITVDEAAVINSFVSNVAEASPGSNITLVWDVANGSSVTIDNGIGAVDPVSGTVIVPVNEETTFTLTATNSQGPVTESVTITLADASLPVAHWRVGEAAGEKDGSVLIGEGGSLFDGLFVGTPSFDVDDPAPVPGGSTASIAFDGAGSWIDVSGYDGVGGDSARTLAFWFKGDLVQPNLNATLVSWGTGATGARFDTRINTAGVNQLRTEVAGSGSNATTPIVTGEWHHCAVVFNPVLGTTIGDALFYVDGNLEALTASGGTTVNTNASNGVRIGNARVFQGRAVAGKMDDIRIYDRALNEAEIVSLITPGNSQELKIIAIRQLENGNVEVDWAGAPGDYFFEYSLDLTPDSWLEISDSELILQGETTATAVDDFIAPNAENRKVFYRLRPVE